MNGYDYIRKANSFYRPKTPTAALRAVGTGLLPPEAFIYRATSVHPLFEEPVDLAEIERVLARPDNNLETNLLLVRVLERLLVNPDSEIALFAAESINAIENKYNTKITALQSELRQSRDVRLHSSVASNFRDLGMINGSRPAIKRFYLAEAYRHLQERRSGKAGMTKPDLLLLIDVLVELSLYAQAARIMASVRKARPHDTDFAIQAARIAYYERNYDGVGSALNNLSDRTRRLSDSHRQVVQAWRGDA